MATKTEFINCNICSSNSYKIICHKFGLDLVKCKNCGLVYTNPRLLESEILQRYESPIFFDEYLESFKASSVTYDLNFIRNHYYLFIDLIKNYLVPGKKLLDVGSGAGFFLKAAEEIGWQAEGVEISSTASKYAAEIAKVNVHYGKLEDLKFPSETFDLVTLLDIIEHLPNPLHTLKETNRILKSGGIIIVSTPDFNSLSRLFLGYDWAVLSPAEHLYNFTHKTLCSILSNSYFHVLGIRNLLVFNPEYTNNKNKRGYFLWKTVHTRLEKQKIMENIHGFEYLDLMVAAEENKAKTTELKFTKKLKRIIYKRAKTWLKGDMLIAIAKKA